MIVEIYIDSSLGKCVGTNVVESSEISVSSIVNMLDTEYTVLKVEYSPHPEYSTLVSVIYLGESERKSYVK